MTSNEKSNALTVTSAFQAIIRVDGSFATLAMRVDDADLDAVVTHFNKAVTNTAAELPCKQRPKSTFISLNCFLAIKQCAFLTVYEGRAIKDFPQI